jgi:hypothetical protein
LQCPQFYFYNLIFRSWNYAQKTSKIRLDFGGFI